MKRQCRTGTYPILELRRLMFENSLAKVLENPTDHDLPNYSPEAQKRMNSLSVAGKRNVIHPLVPREMKTRGGEALLPEKL